VEEDHIIIGGLFKERKGSEEVEKRGHAKGNGQTEKGKTTKKENGPLGP